MRDSNLKDNSGIANFVVVILVMVACIGIVTSYIITGRTLIIIENIKEKEAETKIVEKRKGNYTEDILKMSPYITEISQYGMVVDKEKVRKLLEDKIKLYNLQSNITSEEQIGGEDSTLEDIIGIVGIKVTSSYLGVNLAESGKVSAEARYRKFTETRDKIDEYKKSEIDDISAKKNQVSAIETNENVNYNTRIDELNRKRNELTAVRDKKIAELQEERRKIEYKIQLTKQEIESNSSRGAVNRDIIEIQGKIINPAVKDWYAFVNLGEKDNLKLGMKFRVFRRDKNGKRKWKGLVEVKKIFETYSQVSINKLEDELDPILEGDYITNVFYRPNKTLYVALIGSIERDMFHYNLEQIKRKLNSLGVVVETEVSLMTDFAILGRNYEILPTYETMRLLNIPYLENKEAEESVTFYLSD
ncbi:MAG: hypothetical protein HY811_05365 [Planctomycetes bacterium]|nr:hypothetical protein [Planctomycetota bacterium]